MNRFSLWSFCLFAGLLGTQPAMSAGVGSTGGGNVVFCQEKGTVELLDYYEARSPLRGLTIELGGPGLTYLEKAKLVIDRIAQWDSPRAKAYTERLSQFPKESRFLPGVGLKPIDDSSVVAIPIGCELRQAAVQSKPQFPRDPYYVISKDLWDKLSEDDRAGLVLHEIVYREALANGALNSMAARYYNGVMSSKEGMGYTLGDYEQLTDDCKLPRLDGRWKSRQVCAGTGSERIVFDRDFTSATWSGGDPRTLSFSCSMAQHQGCAPTDVVCWTFIDCKDESRLGYKLRYSRNDSYHTASQGWVTLSKENSSPSAIQGEFRCRDIH